jgi:multidrug efflux pump subunit AcrA (membrane-fusion protein)
MKSTLIKIIVGVVIVAGLSGLGYWGYETYLKATPPAPTTAVTIENGVLTISAEGKVQPARSARLSFMAAGLVEEVLVEEGQTVQKDQVVARLEGSDRLVSAQQALDALYENAGVASSEARVAAIQAEEDYDEAQRVVNYLGNPARTEDIQTAEGVAELARSAMDAAKKDSNNCLDPENLLCREARVRLYATEQAYNQAVANLNYLKSLGDTTSADYKKAAATRNAALEKLNLAQQRADELALGPDQDALQLAESRLKNAEAQADAARGALADLELRAPFDGTMVSAGIKVGELAAPGVPVFVMADLTRWQVKTTNLVEKDVAALQLGMKAEITLDAFPDQTFQGQVSQISLMGVEQRGSATYAVTLDFDPGSAPVRWEMSAFVDIPIINP